MKSLRSFLGLLFLGSAPALLAQNAGVERAVGQSPSLAANFEAYNRNLVTSAGAFTIDLRNHFTIPGVNASQLVQLKTNFGTLNVELLAEDAPLTVANFKAYLATDSTSAADRAKTYDNTIIHRSVSDFVIQGGGFRLTGDLATLDAKPAVVNEFKVANTRGTIAMAKLGDQPNSATNQWFINLDDNREILDNQNGGFTAFARVIGAGMDIADDIADLEVYNLRDSIFFSDFFDTHPNGGAFNEVPLDDYNGSSNLLLSSFVTIQSVRLLPLQPPASGNGASIITYSLTNSDPVLAKTVLANGRLSVTPSKYPGQAVITIRASEAAGAFAEGTFTLERIGAPVLIKALPSVTEAPLGQNITLVAQVAAWPFNLKWQYRSSSSASWADLADDDRYTGSTSRSLQIKLPAATTPNADASLALTGFQFRFVVTNTISDVTRTLESAPTTLRVTPTLAFKDKLAKTTTAKLGDNVVLVARAADATLPAATYQWQRLPVGADAKVETNWQNLANAAAASGETPAVLSPYSGVTTHTLTISLKGTTPATAPGISTAATLALDKSQYRCVIRHDRGEGSVPFASTATTLRITTLPVGFAAQPPKLFTGQLGGNATVSVTSLPVATNTPVTYQWERLAAGQSPKVASNWQPVVNSTGEAPTRYTGVTTRTLTISLAGADETAKLAALALNDDQYRCVITVPVLGTKTSTAAALRVITEDYTAVTQEDILLPGLSDLTSDNFTVAGVPKGLVFNANGRLSGTPTAKPGFYKVVVTVRKPGGAVEVRVYYIEVRALSGNLVGSFEALLAPTDSAHFGKLALIVSANGSFTGTLLTANDKTARPFKGTVLRNATTGALSLPAPLAITRPGQPAGHVYLISDFSITTSAGVLTATVSRRDGVAASPVVKGASTTGVRLASYSASNPAPWAYMLIYNLALTKPTPLSASATPVPAGSGYARAPINASGLLKITGKLPDGAPLTASVATGTDASYRVFTRPYGGVDGAFLSSDFKLTATSGVVNPRGGTFTRYALAENGGEDTYWQRPAGVTKPANYAEGFGPLGLTLRAQPWLFFFGNNLGLTFTGANETQVITTGIAFNGAILSAAPNLPASLVLNAAKLTFSDATLPDPSQLALKLNQSTGVVTGSLLLADGRKVSLEGVFLVPAIANYNNNFAAGTVTVEGFATIPAIAGSDETPTTERFRLHQLGATPTP